MRLTISAIIVVALAHAAIGGDAKTDLKKFQGTWTASSPDGKSISLKVAGDKFVFEVPDENAVYKGVFKIDPAKKPAQIDMKVIDSTKEFKGQTAVGIYEWNDKGFRWCSNLPGQEQRPTEFSAPFLLLDFAKAK